jgi:hypothetical protein
VGGGDFVPIHGFFVYKVEHEGSQNKLWLRGVVTLTSTQVIVTNVWFCVSKILEKDKELQLKLLSHTVIFNVYIYIIKKFKSI